MGMEEELKKLEKMRANGDLTEGEFLARKHKLATEPEKKSPLNPAFSTHRLDDKKKKGKAIPIIVILLIAAAAACYWFFLR